MPVNLGSNNWMQHSLSHFGSQSLDHWPLSQQWNLLRRPQEDTTQGQFQDLSAPAIHREIDYAPPPEADTILFNNSSADPLFSPQLYTLEMGTSLVPNIPESWLPVREPDVLSRTLDDVANLPLSVENGLTAPSLTNTRTTITSTSCTSCTSGHTSSLLCACTIENQLLPDKMMIGMDLTIPDIFDDFQFQDHTSADVIDCIGLDQTTICRPWLITHRQLTTRFRSRCS
jgi:hypothetical protein